MFTLWCDPRREYPRRRDSTIYFDLRVVPSDDGNPRVEGSEGRVPST